VSSFSEKGGAYSAKFGPPEYFIDVLERPELIAALNSKLNLKSTIIHAPAGYGKTTLLALWKKSLVDQGVQVMWLNLDEEDGDPNQFTIAFQTATQILSAAAKSNSKPASAEFFSQPETSRTLFNRSLETLSRLEGRVVVILDDYHVAASAPLDQLMQYLFTRQPANLHVVIASRAAPLVALASLRPLGQILEISAADLSFSEDETAKFFDNSLPVDDLAQITISLGGWPVSLQLLKLWREKSGPDQNMLALIELSHQDLGDFLTTKVLAGLSEAARMVLLNTSILDAFSVDVANAICGRKDCHEIMAEIQKLDALMVEFRQTEASGQQIPWLRCHHLLRDFLSRKLAEQGLDHIKGLHRLAADWFSGRGDVAEAVKHAVRSGDVDDAARLIEQAGAVRIGLMRGLPVLLRLLNTLPIDTIYRHPRLHIARAWLLAKLGRLGEARACFEAACATIEDDRHMEDALLRQERLFVDLMLSAVYEDKVWRQAEISRIEALARDVSPLDHWFQGWINNLLCIIHTRGGALANAREATETATIHYLNAGATYGLVFMHLHSAIINILSGRLYDSEIKIEKAAALADAQFPTDTGVIGLINIVRAQILYERNDLEAASHLLEHTLPEIDHAEGWVELYSRGYQVMSAIALAETGFEAAIPYLLNARKIGEERGLPRLVWLADCRRVELLTLAGRLDEAASEAKTTNAFLHADNPDFVSWREREKALLAEARLAIACNQASGIIPQLTLFRKESESCGRDRAVMEICLIQALAYHALLDRDQAIEALKKALLIAIPEKFYRVFIDEGEPMARLLRATVRHIGVVGMPRAMVDFLSEIMSILNARGQSEDKAVGHILSLREIEVLRELSLQRANKVIARNLNLTEATVKFHLANIYRKLGVNSRIMAVNIAQGKHLIDSNMPGT
jgi:LuxR family maltose regulon positive regulatory protein